MSRQKLGVIFVNLGTPESPSAGSVRQFLREFLSDRRVVDVPKLPWKILLNTIILPLRSPKVARAYRSIWSERGSPLRSFTQDLAEGLRLPCEDGPLADSRNQTDRADENSPGVSMVTTWAMTYGKPTVQSRIDEFGQQGVSKILVIPLYPQFSSSTTGAVYDRLADITRASRNIPDIRCVHNYCDHPLYIEALAISVTEHWQEFGRNERLLMSFHGLPESYSVKGDPYIEQCNKTASLLADRLKLGDDKWAISFQSRFGPANWVKPYTNEVLVDWAQNGIKNIDVICPSFSVDCLETLEEVGQQYVKLFVQSGGMSMSLVPCLNSSPSQIKLMEKLIFEHSR